MDEADTIVPGPPARRPAILFADDSLTMRSFISKVFQERDYRSEGYDNGRPLLERALASPGDWDLILLDASMPGMDGLETLRALKAQPSLAPIPVIFLSSLNDKDSVVEALHAGARDYVPKPCQVAELIARIETQLEVSRMRREIIAQRDILAEASDGLAKANRQLLKLFGILAHDLRGPLGGFATYLDYIVEEAGLSSVDEGMLVLRELRRSSRSLFSLLENLLEWARCQRGELNLEPRLLDLGELVVKAMGAFESAAESKGISLLVSAERGVMAYCDDFAAQTVVRNLVGNAIKFTPGGGEIRVRVARFDGDWATVDVADTGVGMAPELIDRLFDSSEHITTLGTADERGTGLGLNLCHYLSTRLGGSIAVESEPARGSVFHFRLPSRAR